MDTVVKSMLEEEPEEEKKVTTNYEVPVSFFVECLVKSSLFFKYRLEYFAEYLFGVGFGVDLE